MPQPHAYIIYKIYKLRKHPPARIVLFGIPVFGGPPSSVLLSREFMIYYLGLFFHFYVIRSST